MESDALTGAPPPSAGRRPASAALAALDLELRTRFARRTGSIEAFLKEWIRLDASRALLFGAYGVLGENYLQYNLANGDLDMAAAIVTMCSELADSTGAEGVAGFLNHVDSQGNDIWHYLADNLVAREDEKALTIARNLTHLEISYLRKNTDDETALGRLLMPEVKWQSVNSMLLVKPLSILELEAALPARILDNEPVRREILTGIMSLDITANGAALCAHFLKYALSPRADGEEREAVLRVMFDYVGGARADTVFQLLMETDHRLLVDMALQFLHSMAEAACLSLAGDMALSKSRQQIYLYRRLSMRNKLFHTALSKAVIAGKLHPVVGILDLVRNEDVAVSRRTPQGQTTRETLIIDKTSPSPSNPALSLLLAQDVRGNMPLHLAVLGSNIDCVKKLLFGLSPVDSYVFLRRIPNRYGLTVMDLLTLKAAHAKLAVEVKSQRLALEEAQRILGRLKQIDPAIASLLTDMVTKIEAILQRSGSSPESVRPSFDLKRVPTIMLSLQNRPPAAALSK